MQPHSAAAGAEPGAAARSRQEKPDLQSVEPRGQPDVRASVPCVRAQRRVRRHGNERRKSLADPGSDATLPQYLLACQRRPGQCDGGGAVLEAARRVRPAGEPVRRGSAARGVPAPAEEADLRDGLDDHFAGGQLHAVGQAPPEEGRGQMPPVAEPAKPPAAGDLRGGSLPSRQPPGSVPLQSPAGRLDHGGGQGLCGLPSLPRIDGGGHRLGGADATGHRLPSGSPVAHHREPAHPGRRNSWSWPGPRRPRNIRSRCAASAPSSRSTERTGR